MQIHLLLQYIKDGQLIQKLPNLFEIKKYHQKQIASLHERFKKINHIEVKYPVLLSPKLTKIMKELEKERV